MDNKDYLDKLIDLQKVVKRIDYQISELASEKRRYILDYLSTLPFQEGDKVKTKSGDVIVIECLQNAFPLPLFLESGIKVQFSFRRIKKNGEISKRVQQGYGMDYFNLKKVVELKEKIFMNKKEKKNRIMKLNEKIRMKLDAESKGELQNTKNKPYSGYWNE